MLSARIALASCRRAGRRALGAGWDIWLFRSGRQAGIVPMARIFLGFYARRKLDITVQFRPLLNCQPVNL